MAIPVSLEDAKHQLRIEIDDTSRDDELLGWIADAAGWVERYTGHTLEAVEVVETLVGANGRWPALQSWPVADPIALSVGDAPHVAGIINPGRRPAQIAPLAGLRLDGKTFTATVRAGYPDAASVPRNFRRAMLILIAAYDDDREGGDAFAKAEAAAKSLCRSFRRGAA